MHNYLNLGGGGGEETSAPQPPTIIYTDTAVGCFQQHPLTAVNKPSIILYSQTRESTSYGIILFLVWRMTITKTELILASVNVILIKKLWLISVLLLSYCDESVIGKYDTLWILNIVSDYQYRPVDTFSYECGLSV